MTKVNNLFTFTVNKNNMKAIPTEISKLISAEGFREAYFELLPKFKFKYEAYEALEKKYFSYFGVNRYGSYNAFRNLLVRWRKEKNK